MATTFTTSKGTSYTFYNAWKSTYNGFKHESEMRGSDGSSSFRKINYLNRTWECYEYQTVMLQCVHQEMDYVREGALEEAKQELGLKRATDKVRKLQEEILSKSERLADLEELYSLIYNRK